MKEKLLFLMIIFYNFSTAQCWTEVSVGGYHSLAVKEDGTLWAWGRNNQGQLGDGTLTDKLTPVQIGTDQNWKMVAAGYYYSFAIKVDGTLWAWGDNLYYQLGDGTMIDKTTPIQIGVDSDWKFVEAGFVHTIALKTNGTLWVCGSNANYVLGNGDTAPYNIVMGQIGTQSDWQSVSTSRWHTQAIKNDGTLWAWGRGYPGLLGNGTINNSTIPIQIGTDNDWKSVTANDDSNAAVKLNGTLWTWGGNSQGQLGNNTTQGSSTVPIQIGSGWNSVSSSSGSVYGIKNDGSLWSWGSNFGGQLALGYESNNVPVPTQVGTANNWDKLAKGIGSHFFVINSEKVVWATGLNLYGQLGNNTIIDQSNLTPQNCTLLSNFAFAEEDKLRVFPNPSHDYVILNFEGKHSPQFQYEFLDMSGRVIANGKGLLGEKIYIDKFNSGSYFIRVEIEKQFYLSRILKGN